MKFIEAFRSCARAGDARRILISGSADYSLLAHVLYGYRIEGVEPEVTVLDICETPLEINRWYAERTDACVSTEACSVLNYHSDIPFDVVVADNFFRFIRPTARPQLIDSWRRLLRPEGYVVATQSVTNPLRVERRVRSQEEIEKKRKHFLQLAEARKDALGIPLAELGAYVEEHYHEHNRRLDPRSHGSEEELQSLYEKGGFRIERRDNLTTEGRRHRPILDPDRKHNDRFFILARRAADSSHRLKKF